MPANAMSSSATNRLVPALEVARYRFTFGCASEVQFGGFPGFVLYGALKSLMRAQACRTRPTCNKLCKHPVSCAYGQVFETRGPTSDGQSGFENAPHPLVLHFPDNVEEILEPGDRLRFDILLLGKATTQGRHVTEAMQRVERSGLGLARRDGLGRVRLHDIEMTGPMPLEQMVDKAQSVPSRSLGLTFVTPLRLRYGKQWMNEQTFSLPIFVRSLARRIHLLARFHGGQAPSWEVDAFVKFAEDLRISRQTLIWESQNRFSGLQRRFMPMDGLRGCIDIEGSLPPLLPLLALGQVVHVGSKTTMGLGQIKIK